VANKMADKKKNSSQRSTRNQSQVVTAKVRGDGMAEPKARRDEKEQNKQVKAVAGERGERKVQESKTVRRENKSQSKGAPGWQIRLRSNRYFQFVLDSYYELRHKVTWPSFNEARNMTIAVILLSLAIGAILGVADFGLQHLYVLLVH
jgi:preprotein translocase SecE subunit